MTYEQLDIFLTGLIYLAAIFVLFVIGKVMCDKLHPRFDLKQELFEHDNFAMSLNMVGYYFGLVLALGGVLGGEGHGLWQEDLFDIFFFGLAAVVLINLSAFLNDKIILSKFDNQKEILEDRNAGTGAILAGNHIANGLIISGAVSGADVTLPVALAFWGLGQVALIVIARLYAKIVSFDLHDEIEKDNVAVGVAFAGILIAVGNLVRLSVSGDFHSWGESIKSFAVYLAMGVVILPVVRWVTDKILVPGVKLDDELVARAANQSEPNVGAGALEAFSYIAASMLVGWAIF